MEGNVFSKGGRGEIGDEGEGIGKSGAGGEGIAFDKKWRDYLMTRIEFHRN